MGKAIGYVVIVGLVLVLGLHPGVFAGMIHELFVVLRGAGNEISTFISQM